MAVATAGTARLTSDPVAPEQLKGDIARLFDALAAGDSLTLPMTSAPPSGALTTDRLFAPNPR